MSRSMSFIRAASDQLSKSALTSDWIEAMASLPTSVTSPMLSVSIGSRASQSVAGAVVSPPAAVVSDPAAVVSDPAAVVSDPAAVVSVAPRRWCRRERWWYRASGGGVGAGGGRHVATLGVVIVSTCRQHEAGGREHRDKLGRFHAPPVCNCWDWVGGS